MMQQVPGRTLCASVLLSRLVLASTALAAGTATEGKTDPWVEHARKLQARPPMPFWALNRMRSGDLRAVYRYVRSLGPGGRPAPDFVPPGAEPRPPYVQFPAPPK